MATAYKCDICGKYCDEAMTIHGLLNPDDLASSLFGEITSADCCKDCYRSIMRHITQIRCKGVKQKDMPELSPKHMLKIKDRTEDYYIEEAPNLIHVVDYAECVSRTITRSEINEIWKDNKLIWKRGD